MKPATPLPWKELPCYFDNQCMAFEPRDADYILYAANTLPELITDIERLTLNTPTLTRELAFSAGQDAANNRMRSQNRTVRPVGRPPTGRLNKRFMVSVSQELWEAVKDIKQRSKFIERCLREKLFTSW
jgi:hypothetical protein